MIYSLFIKEKLQLLHSNEIISLYYYFWEKSIKNNYHVRPNIMLTYLQGSTPVSTCTFNPVNVWLLQEANKHG